MAQRLSKDHYLNSEKMLCKRLKSDKVGRHYHSRRVVSPIMIRRNLTYKNKISRIIAGILEMCKGNMAIFNTQAVRHKKLYELRGLAIGRKYFPVYSVSSYLLAD